jgi:hypothetical protein
MTVCGRKTQASVPPSNLPPRLPLAEQRRKSVDSTAWLNTQDRKKLRTNGHSHLLSIPTSSAGFVDLQLVTPTATLLLKRFMPGRKGMVLGRRAGRTQASKELLRQCPVVSEGSHERSYVLLCLPVPTPHWDNQPGCLSSAPPTWS